MQLTLLSGYPDVIGRRRVIVAFGNGPISYVPFVPGVLPALPSGGDPLQGLPFQWYTDWLSSNNMSPDGQFVAMAQPYAVDARQIWVLRYFAFAPTSPAIGAEVAAGTNLSTHQFQLFIAGGSY